MRENSLSPLHIELLVVPDCPSHAPARAQLRAVLDELGLTHIQIETTVITSDDAAVARGFTGSPSLRVNGVDPLSTSGPVGLSCRLYRTAAGLSGLPDTAEVQAAIASATERSSAV